MKVEALEWCFGVGDPQACVIPGIDPTWTDQGVLFAFSDQNDMFMAIDPSSGAYQQVNSAFQVTDAEGLAFFHWTDDPRNPLDEPFD